MKYNFRNNQLTKFNLVGVVEGHSDNAKIEVFKAASRLVPMVSFWEHGRDSGSGGLGLLIQEAFFKKFQYYSWDIISPLQCGRLTLIGREGWLDIYVVYADSRGFEHRKPLYNNLKAKMRPQQQAVSYLMGDWNFATCHYDRIFNPSYQYTGDNDKEEAKHFVKLLAKPCGFRELAQEEYTFHGGPERWDSRIDRIYSNSHLADVQDKDISCFRTNYKSRISDHSPVAFIVATKHKRDNVNTIPDWVCKHPDWDQLCTSEFSGGKLPEDPFQKLMKLQSSFHKVAKEITKE